MLLLAFFCSPVSAYSSVPLFWDRSAYCSTSFSPAIISPVWPGDYQLGSGTAVVVFLPVAVLAGEASVGLVAAAPAAVAPADDGEIRRSANEIPPARNVCRTRKSYLYPNSP